MEVAEDRSESAVVVVYLHGVIGTEAKELWYRVELPIRTNGNNNNGKKRKRDDDIHVYPVGLMCRETYGYSGRWTVIGDDIYWIGGFNRLRFQPREILNKNLLKHNVNDADPTSWKVVSSSMNIRRRFPFVTAVPIGREKHNRLCVISGAGYRSLSVADPYDSTKWKQCGEMYHIKKKTWDLIDVDFKDISGYTTYNQIAQDVQKPTEIVFYCLRNGSMMVVDVANNSKGPVLYSAGLDLWMSSLPPKGLIDPADVNMLRSITHNAPAVLVDGTFYWCTHIDLHLYGYDTKEEKWLRSPSLKNDFPPIFYDREDPQLPLLLGLGNGKFVLVLAIDYGHSIMAIITVDKMVDKRGNSLGVSVDRFHHVYFDDEPVFLPIDGKAMLKNTGSGSMR